MDSVRPRGHGHRLWSDYETRRGATACRNLFEDWPAALHEITWEHLN